MTRTTGKWQRVSRRRPCPVCGKPKWCLFAGDPNNPTAVICARVESPNRRGDAGWLHRLRDDDIWHRTRRTIRLVVPKQNDGAGIDFGKLAVKFCQAVEPDALGRLADNLGLTTDSLTRLSIGWSQKHLSWAFPMTDTGGNVLGIRLRLSNGRKLSVRSGREGLFIPSDLQPGSRLLVAEGPTDCAALLGLRFQVVGRPSCTGGTKHLTRLVGNLEPSDVVVVADADEAGRCGAERLAAMLVACVKAVRVITPPDGIKDARAWVCAGATAATIQAVIDAAPVRRLLIHSRKVGQKHHGR